MSELSTQWLRSERASLAKARGRRKLDVILDSRQPEALVASLPAEDLFFAIQEIGLADSAPIVRLATPEQFRLFVDLDAWKGDEIDPEKVLLWLRLARGPEDEEYRARLAGLDLEVLELLLRGIVRVFDLEEDGEPPDELEGTIEHTAEGRFVLVYPSEGAEYAAARRLIQDLYAEDPFRAGRLLYAVRWELESELNETAWRWRNARLADLGFPSPQEAASLYAKVDPSAPLPAPGAPPDEPPGFFLASLESGTLLDRALGLLPDEARDELQLQLVAVMNASFVADRVDVSDSDAVRAQAQAVRATIELGLSQLAGDEPVRASTLLAGASLKHLFQVGFTCTLELSWKAQRLVRELPLRLAANGAFLPDAPDGDALETLLRRRPRYHGGLDGPGARAEVRAFATHDEILRAGAALDRIEALGLSLKAAGLEPARAAASVIEAWGDAGISRARFGELFVTAAAREASGLDFAFASLPASMLDEAARAAFDDDARLRPAFRQGAIAALERAAGAIEAPVRAAAEAALDRLEAEVGPQLLAEGRLDPRFAAPWIVPA
ncbi:DUF6178 family protein [Vulgatibacter incomptus]|uniref:Uncharacterized protein n=1 Tax=Vulgatibacter incomptus TaxID=1391653 RepID=A0A0K1P8N1_9BACT|nr:DUF6178 family protein [Vulgatibacter incomptus]AKU89862.1 hypothetical protein AKJ08_0249 [Vulgatibacter incomptus]